MCPVEKVASCEMAFVPVQSAGYARDVERLLELIAASGLSHTVGSMSTLVQGNASDILSLVERIYREMDSVCSFVLDLRLSNLCGCGI